MALSEFVLEVFSRDSSEEVGNVLQGMLDKVLEVLEGEAEVEAEDPIAGAVNDVRFFIRLGDLGGWLESVWDFVEPHLERRVPSGEVSEYKGIFDRVTDKWMSDQRCRIEAVVGRLGA